MLFRKISQVKIPRNLLLKEIQKLLLRILKKLHIQVLIIIEIIIFILVETNEIFIQSDVKISYTDIAELIKQDPEKIFLPLTKYKNSCFNCFKVFLINKGFESSGKPFCSIPCKQEFQDKYNV